MMNRTYLNLALLLVAAGLGLAVFLSQEKEEKGPPLTALTPDAVTRIVIEHPDSAAIRLEKKDGRWSLTAPVSAAVDELEINALLDLAGKESKERLTGAALAELNLDPPQYTITLNDTAIAFGGVEPLRYRRYVKTGDGVHLIEDPPSAALDQDYADLVAKNLFHSGAEIERIELPKLNLFKDKDGGWAVKPADPKASADSMQKLADGWKSARSMWNEQARNPKPKGDVVRITLKGGETAQFVVVERDPQFKLYRAEAGVNYVLSKALADELLKLPEPLPEKTKEKTPAPSVGPAGDQPPGK